MLPIHLSTSLQHASSVLETTWLPKSEQLSCTSSGTIAQFPAHCMHEHANDTAQGDSPLLLTCMQYVAKLAVGRRRNGVAQKLTAPQELCISYTFYSAASAYKVSLFSARIADAASQQIKMGKTRTGFSVMMLSSISSLLGTLCWAKEPLAYNQVFRFGFILSINNSSAMLQGKLFPLMKFVEEKSSFIIKSVVGGVVKML